MNGRRLALLSIVATFSLLAFLFSPWVKPVQALLPNLISQQDHLVCNVTNSTVYLTEVKPRIVGLGSSLIEILLSSFLIPLSNDVDAHYQRAQALTECQRPLWLLHRSLLI